MRSTQITSHPPVGVILAGGPGDRIGGNKASVALQGEPLLHHAACHASGAQRCRDHRQAPDAAAAARGRDALGRARGADAPDARSGGGAGAGRRPLVGLYTAAAAPLLSAAAQSQVALEEVAGLLDPRLLEVENELELFDIDTPDDLLRAAGMLDLQRRSVRA